jgi:hypothetical protein
VKTSSLTALIIAIILVVSLLAVWFYPSVQDFMASNNLWNGVHDFSRDQQVAALKSTSQLTDYSGRTALVAIPYLQYSNAELDHFNQYILDGNLLVILDDFGYGNQLLERLGLEARFDGHNLLDPLICYKNSNFPRVLDFAPEVKAAGIQAIVFNHATCLQNVTAAHGLAWSSATSFVDLNHNGKQDPDEKAGPFAVAAEYRVGPGLVRLVSDPSLIINTMVGQNDNQAFSNYLLHWGSEPRRTLLDYSHLTKSTLDHSKDRLISWRVFLANPYVTIGLIAALMALVVVYVFRKGGIFG